MMAAQLFLPLALFSASTLQAPAQISLATAVDLALRTNPRVLGAHDDVAKARAQLAETHDVYVPSITAGSGAGQAYGYSPYPPTLFTVNSGSLVYNPSQKSYIRSAQTGLDAAQLALDDVRELVAQDTALAFVALDHDQQRDQVIRQQAAYADGLVQIVQQRLDGGQDTQINLTQAKLTAAQFRLNSLRAQDEIANDRNHLALLIGLPSAALNTDGVFPSTALPAESTVDPDAHGYATAAVAAAFANAEARRQQALGDARFRYRPQISLVAQYNFYATYTNSFAQLDRFNKSSGNGNIDASEGAFGIQVNFPLLDKSRAAKARESAADASKALHDAQNGQIDALDGQSRTRHTLAELQVQVEVATLQQQLSQQQLDVLHLQLENGTGNNYGPQMSPKDEQNARIAERDKYLGVIDANFQMRQAKIQLLRQTGELELWLESSVTTQQPSPSGNLSVGTTPKR
jgi:outer membrane protein TolC